jgi:PAS domain S-box-containing protein
MGEITPDRISEEAIRAVAALTPFPIGITRISSGALVYVNDAFARFMGSTVGDLLGRPAPELYARSEDRDRMLELLEEQGELVDHEILAHLPDGTTRLTLVTLQIVEFQDEPSIMASVVDITERHRTEAALRDERKRLAGILELAGEAVISIAADGRIILFNRAAEEMFGYAEEEAIGEPLELLLPPASHALHRDHVEGFVHGDVTAKRMGIRSEVIGRRKSGELFPAGASISKLALDEHVVSTAIVRDLSAQKEAEAALEQSRAQLRHAQKMEAIGRLAGGVAHDFNNLLTAILGSAALISRRVDADSPIAEEIREIRRATDRAAQLTQSLLAFGRKQPMRPTVVDLRKVVADARRMLVRAIGEHVELRVVESDQSVNALVDPGQIEQVLVNLVINAADAMEDGGAVTIAADRLRLDAPVPTPHGRVSPGEWGILTVADTGVGMDESTMSRIFEPFFTTKAVGVGTGLGLATVHGIVEQSCGAIEVLSELGRGTTFRVYLPLSLGEGSRDEEAAASRDAPVRGGNERILVVEDNAMLLRLCVRVLSAAGYDVLAAENGAVAIRMAEELERPVDLVLTDVIMPGPKGPDVARALRERWPNVPVLYMTGYSEDVLTSEDEGEPRLLTKPFHPDTLKALVRKALDQRGDRTR